SAAPPPCGEAPNPSTLDGAALSGAPHMAAAGGALRLHAVRGADFTMDATRRTSAAIGREGKEEEGEREKVGSQETATPEARVYSDETIASTQNAGEALARCRTSIASQGPTEGAPLLAGSGLGQRQGGTVHARGRPPCRRQALRARRARRREPGRELACRARQPSVAARLSAQGPRSSRGPRAARGGGSRTAGSRQTSRTAPGARVQRASSDPRGTTQPARALHNARDADEMVRQNGGVNPSSAPCVVQPPLYGAPRQLSRLDQARRMPRARRLEVVHALHLGPGPGSAMAERASSEVHGAGRRMSPGGDRRGRKREGSTRAPCTGTPFRPRAGSRAGERSLAYAGSW
ncbi:unnamed protein product, partial [Prorocentrum cordatum]